MPEPSQVSPSPEPGAPPTVRIPRVYNAAWDLLERNNCRRDKVAFIDTRGSHSFDEISDRAYRFASALRSLGFPPESRILLALRDTADFPVAFLGSMLAGVVPVAANTMLTSADFAFMLRDSRARGLVVSAALLPLFRPLLAGLPYLRTVVVSGDAGGAFPELDSLIAGASAGREVDETSCDDPCFWLYSSGSTGAPKGTVHLHSHLIQTAELYARPILGISEDDIVFSAAKLFFAYGLGNGLTFPLSVGATSVLLEDRPTPSAVWDILRRHQPTIFYGVPTLYAALLADPGAPTRQELRLRVCASAGEALPAEIGRRFSERYGVEVLDGIGSTEMLHIFISNRPGSVRLGTTGQVVPGYRLVVLDEDGQRCPPGTLGELYISGPSSALHYWNDRARTKATFQGEWTRSGDKYSVSDDGYYTYGGRADDMLKVGGIYVSPVEVEGALLTHPAVLEAAVVGAEDPDGLVKPKAYIVLQAGKTAEAAELQAHVKALLAPYKYPRWVEFVQELPKTATGKIQRFKLRAGGGGRVK